MSDIYYRLVIIIFIYRSDNIFDLDWITLTRMKLTGPVSLHALLATLAFLDKLFLLIFIWQSVPLA